MTEENANLIVWQVGSGGGTRQLSTRFINHGVAAIGPGDPGDFRLSDKYDSSIVGKRDLRFVHDFSCKVRPGHLFILRSGRQRAIAVGRVILDSNQKLPDNVIRHDVSPSYIYVDGLGDEDGWDLQHAHRVVWHVFEKEIDFGRAVFGGSIPARFSQVTDHEVLDWAYKNAPAECSAPLPDLPPPLTRLIDTSVADDLFRLGLPLKSVGDTMEAITRIRRLSNWYASQGWPAEHEVVGYMVLPLLTALGWSEQQMGVEWSRMDIAIFRKRVNDDGKLRRNDTCNIVIEVKTLYEGLSDCMRQAIGYCYQHKLDNCQYCVATDGVRYRLFDTSSWRKNGGLDPSNLSDEELSGEYLNLERISSTKVLQRLIPTFSLS